MSDTVLEFHGLHKSYRGVPVLKGIDATARVGDVIGLLGLNGAGKTTLLESVLGLCPPSSGSARLFGRKSHGGLDDATRARIGFVPQRDELLDAMSGKRYLALIAAFYQHWNHALVERKAAEWQVPLDMRIATLSIGQRQKLSILSALGHEPELIILDEPVASLDPVARRQFLKDLVDIASSQTRTIIFSTHIVNDLERVSSRLWLLKDGVLALDEDIDALKERRPESLEDIFLEAHQ